MSSVPVRVRGVNPNPNSTTSTRYTKSATIERTITVTADDDFDTHTVWATVFERHVLKTKVNLVSEVYILERIPADFGVGVHVEKQLADGEAYDVNISDALGNQCSCPAGAYYRGECRHMAMAKQAIRLGLI
jgi:hypothetical protein